MNGANLCFKSFHTVSGSNVIKLIPVVLSGCVDVKTFNILVAGLCAEDISIFKESHPALCDIFSLDAVHLSIDNGWSIT